MLKVFNEISFSASWQSLSVPWLQDWRLCRVAVWHVSKPPKQSEWQTAPTLRPAAQLREESLVSTTFKQISLVTWTYSAWLPDAFLYRSYNISKGDIILKWEYYFKCARMDIVYLKVVSKYVKCFLLLVSGDQPNEILLMWCLQADCRDEHTFDTY